MDIAIEREGIRYALLSAEDIDRLYILGFEFFKSLGVRDYRLLFQVWCSKPTGTRIRLYGAVGNDNELVGWCSVDEFEAGNAKDGAEIHVVRGIEVKPTWQGKGIGTTLLAVATRNLEGYIFVKAITPTARSFWKHLGFSGGGVKDVMAEYDPRYVNYLSINTDELRSVVGDYYP